MIIYITIIITKESIKPIKPICNNTNINNDTNTQMIYDDRPSLTYVKMFQQPSVGFGYQDFDNNDNSKSTSFYTSSNYYEKSNK